MIKCPICNKEFKESLSAHIRVHKINVQEFKSLYPDYPLVTEEYHRKQSQRIKDANTSEVRKKKSESMEKVWENPEYRDKMYKVHVLTQSDKELQKRKSKALKNTWKNKEVRDKIVKAQIEAQKRGIVKSKKSIAGKKNWEKPEYRSKVRSSRSPRKLDCGETIVFRSSWENKVSVLLDIMSIPWYYEVEGFTYINPEDSREHTYYPDFKIVLGNKDIYLEVKPNNQKDSPKNIAKLNSVLNSGHMISYITEDDIKDIKVF